MQTQEQKLARRRSDVILSRVEQTLPQFGGRIRDAEEIARDPAVRRDDHDACRMRELALLGIVRVAKADTSCQGGGRAGRSGEKVPSAQRFAGRRREARACARLGAFRRIDADRDDAIARARLEIDRAQALRQRLANRAAKVGAFVVAQKEHDGVRRQIVRERLTGAAFVGEARIERQDFAQMLIEADLGKLRRRRRLALCVCARQRETKRSEEQDTRLHCASRGAPLRSAVSRIACSMGICAIPRGRSTQRRGSSGNTRGPAKLRSSQAIANPQPMMIAATMSTAATMRRASIASGS